MYVFNDIKSSNPLELAYRFLFCQWLTSISNNMKDGIVGRWAKDQKLFGLSNHWSSMVLSGCIKEIYWIATGSYGACRALRSSPMIVGKEWLMSVWCEPSFEISELVFRSAGSFKSAELGASLK